MRQRRAKAASKRFESATNAIGGARFAGRYRFRSGETRAIALSHKIYTFTYLRLIFF